MSAKAVLWARDQRVSAAQKVVLFALASHHNPKDERCFPSQALLGLETGLSRRGVQLALAGLVDAGLVTVEKERTGGKWASSIYRLAMPETAPKKSRDHAHVVRPHHSAKTEHGAKTHHAHPVSTKGSLLTDGGKNLAKIEEKPALRLLLGGRA